MTRLVVTLTAASLADALDAARRVPDAADLVECRLDFLDRVDDATLHALADALPERALATYRPVSEGGRFDGPEDARERVLSGALDAGFAAVDVEHDAPFADRVLQDARRAGALGIMSRHDFEATPGVDALVKFAERAHERGASVAKYATLVRDGRDAQVLVDASLACGARGLAVAFMGVNDAFLRLLAPPLGLALAYAAPDARAVVATNPADSSDSGVANALAAPGQRPVEDVHRVHAALAATAPDASARLVFLFGDPVAHSRSPRFQNAAFCAARVPAQYVATPVAPSRLAHAVASLRALDAIGANVTVPHKVAVLEHVDDVDASARDVGAANTLVQRDGRVTAFNTDGAGALDALVAYGVAVAGERALVVGAGGAARAIAHALAGAGADVTITNRTEENARALADAAGARVAAWGERADAVKAATLVVNTTTLGLRASDAPPVPVDALTDAHAVFDAVYAPGGTSLVRAARRARCRAVVPGEEMLLHQGARAFTLWTGRDAPVPVMRRALEEAMR